MDMTEIMAAIHDLGFAEREVAIRDVIAQATARAASGQRGSFTPVPGAAVLAVRAISERLTSREISAAQVHALLRTPAMMVARLGPGPWPDFAVASAAELGRARPYAEPVPFTRPPLRAKLLESASDDDLRSLRHAVLVSIGMEFARPLACHDIAAALAATFPDARMEGGHFIGLRGPAFRWGERGGRHSWVRTRDGTIVDAAADQFGYLEIVRIRAGDPRAAGWEVLPPQLRPDGTWVHGQYIETARHQIAAGSEPVRILF